MEFKIYQAAEDDLHTAAKLFDDYRQFYGQPSDLALARAFLQERFVKHDSVIFLAAETGSGSGLGFAQLYPSFSSAAARRLWILNDLFVAEAARRQGIGSALLDTARDYGRATGAKRLVLSTAGANRQAQALYQAHGYQRDEEFLVYKLEL